MYHQQRWTVKKITQRLSLIGTLVYPHTEPLPPFRYLALDGPEAAPPVGADVNTGDWLQLPAAGYWGAWKTDFVLRSTFTVPDAWDKESVALYLPIGEAGDFSHPEALIYIDGQPFAACDRHHQEVLLPPALCDGQPHSLTLHGWTGNGRGKEHAKPLMSACSVVQIHQPTRDFIITARAALGIAQVVDEHDPAQGLLLNALDSAFKQVDLREPFAAAFYASIPAAHTTLKAGIAQAGAPLDVDIYAAGHAHIDVAWLWTLAQTRRKAGRTFHTVLRLMDQFPGYHFTQSQPQLYDYVRQDYPQLFAGIQEAVKEGRWEPIGGMWVEADCNISGPESLARQFLLGRTFFRKYFGVDAESPILWLPDVFGYAWNLPQLIKHAGLDYFFTIKIGWNQYNRMPYDTFWWQGLDGTRVLTHYSPTPDEDGTFASTYNASAVPRTIHGTWTNFQQKEQARDLLMSYGWGDGGGGPTREMIENIQALADFPSTPRVKMDKAINFFRALEANSGDVLPTWKGELYLEYHRGTYTTQSRNKRANRKSEFLLHDAEFLAVYAAIISDYAYPQDTLHHAWELVCLNQFHDIIPGSSIHDVYIDSQAHYQTIRATGESVINEALTAIASAKNSPVVIANPTAFTRDDLALWPDGSADALPADIPTQTTADGLLMDVGALPPYSIFSPQELTPSDGIKMLSVSDRHLQNNYLRMELNDDGDIVRLIDMRMQGREILPEGKLANQFLAFEDRPMNFDAWDIDIFYEDKVWTAEPAESIRVTEEGPLRATIEIKRRILNSTYTQKISLAYNSPRLDIRTDIDWRERHILLKAAFPVDVLTPSATYEVQWGNVERATHRNTSWDWAKFETCAQKWVDLSEGDYGVSLLNDCKYGHDIQDSSPDGGVIRLSLLRSPTNPDPEADQGEHTFTYSLLPHAGTWREGTIAAAYCLNDPIRVFGAAGASEGPAAAFDGSLVAADTPNVVIETVKMAEDGSGVIVRLYESQRKRGPVTLKTGFPLQAAYEVNLLEEGNEPLMTARSDLVMLLIKPYQIRTIKLIPSGPIGIG